MTPEELAAEAAAKAAEAAAKAAADAAKEISHADADSWLDDVPVQAKAYIKQLRGEAKDHRVKGSAAKEQLEQTTKELNAIKAAQADAERKRLEDEANWKALYETEKTGRQTDRQRLVDAEIKSIAAEKGLPIKTVLKLIDKNGIQIDQDGTVSGTDRAVERMLTEFEDVFDRKGKETEAEDKTAEDKGARDGEKVEDFKNRRNLGGSGKDPKPAGAPKQTKFNALTATKEEAAAKYKEFRQKLRAK